MLKTISYGSFPYFAYNLIEMKKNPIDIFSNWALVGRDETMAQGHEDSVEEMLELATIDNIKFSFIDVGCGNGWVVRKILDNPHCEYAAGVDGSQNMIDKAKSMGVRGDFFCRDIRCWIPPRTFDIVHSMEVFYYVEQPDILIRNIFDYWLNPKGKLIMGIDFYHENTPCHSWQEDCLINIMQLFSKNTWISFFTEAGFRKITSYHFGVKDNWKGTLVVMGEK